MGNGRPIVTRDIANRVVKRELTAKEAAATLGINEHSVYNFLLENFKRSNGWYVPDEQ